MSMLKVDNMNYKHKALVFLALWSVVIPNQFFQFGPVIWHVFCLATKLFLILSTVMYSIHPGIVLFLVSATDILSEFSSRFDIRGGAVFPAAALIASKKKGTTIMAMSHGQMGRL
ncbi:hypothetical protein SDJN02_19690, partial [Cucurbita argyrosperma subsp. argyrosperma]